MNTPAEEMVVLLREMRDLQQKHFARYVEFTGKMVESQKQAAIRAEEDMEVALEEQEKFRRMLRIDHLILSILNVIVLGLVFAVVCFFIRR
ncbi:MAG: hypothetical protein ACRC8S_13185 [Fimbriiglobus sp.]